MSYVNNFPKTEFGYIPALALFEKPSVNSGVIGYKWIQYRPISQISSNGNLQFTISGTSNYYVNLKNTYLQIKGQIINTGTQKPITKLDNVALENLPLQTLWSQVDLAFQQKIINSRVGTNYAYKAYIDTILNNSSDEMLNQLTSQLFVKDDAKFFDHQINQGYRLRKTFTAGGKELEMEGPLYLDICQQERPILNGVDINLKFWPNKPTFVIASQSGDYYFKINDAVLNVCMVEVSPAILVGHAAALKESTALYPYQQSDFKAFSIPSGQYEHSIDNIFQGDIPSDLVVGLVSSKAYQGSYDKNPFNFHNFDCSYCGFFINGVSTPTQPYQPLFSNEANKKKGKRALPDSKPPSEREGLEHSSPSEKIPSITTDDSSDNVAYVNSYLSLFGQKYHSAKNIPISMAEYPFGYCLYKFQVSENATDEEGENGFVSIPRRGHTRLTLKFRKPLPEGVTVIIYAHFPRILQIDEARNITV